MRQVEAAHERRERLERRRLAKMARSSHAFVRGNTIQFYEWLESLERGRLPESPAVWICGDCHTGNIGPIGDARGRVELQIRDLDQTVIGNAAHDVIRLGLSLASAARGSDLPGVTTARMLEALTDGYLRAFEPADENELPEPSDTVRIVKQRAAHRTWKHLARERLENTRPTIPLGKRFWPLDEDEMKAIEQLFGDALVCRLATMVRGREDDAEVEVVDAAYWMKGCSSLGVLRYAVLLAVGSGDDTDLCLMDIKEAVPAAAPPYPDTEMPDDDGQRVVEGARYLTPYLGERMRAATLLDRPVFIRELLPQDLKLELPRLTPKQATRTATYLAAVVGRAHARQMQPGDREEWAKALRLQSATLDAPSWLWTSVVELLVKHERAYLEHCRRHVGTASG